MSETNDSHEPGDCDECPESIYPMCGEHMAIEIDELRARLAKVKAERDEARRELARALLDMAAGFAGITPGAE